MVSRTVSLISSWEKDPNQEFSLGELKILQQRGLVRNRVSETIK